MILRERRDIKCRRCGSVFNAPQDHGKWPVCCSRKCFRGDALQPKIKLCPSCGIEFLAVHSRHIEGGLRIYCSRECAAAGLRRGEIKLCVRCGNEFFLSPSKNAHRPADGCCSAKCQQKFYVGKRNPGWKGGKWINEPSGQVRCWVSTNKYMAEHRIIAAEAIGRPLERTETMLHLNLRPDHNKPSNLFICRTMSEARRRQCGSLPWPEKGNLSTYR